MNSIFEGTVSPKGKDQWEGETCDVLSPIPELAAGKVIESAVAEDESLLDTEMDIRVREIDMEGVPKSDWVYFTGKGRKTYRSEVIPHLEHQRG